MTESETAVAAEAVRWAGQSRRGTARTAVLLGAVTLAAIGIGGCSGRGQALRPVPKIDLPHLTARDMKLNHVAGGVFGLPSSIPKGGIDILERYRPPHQQSAKISIVLILHRATAPSPMSKARAESIARHIDDAKGIRLVGAVYANATNPGYERGPRLATSVIAMNSWIVEMALPHPILQVSLGCHPSRKGSCAGGPKVEDNILVLDPALAQRHDGSRAMVAGYFLP